MFVTFSPSSRFLLQLFFLPSKRIYQLRPRFIELYKPLTYTSFTLQNSERICASAVSAPCFLRRCRA